MIALETLLTNIGITQHMAALSDWRDELLRANAAEMQSVHIAKGAERQAAEAKLNEEHAATLAELQTTITAQASSIAELSDFQKRAVESIGAVEQIAKDPAVGPEETVQFVIQAIEIGMAPEEERRKAAIRAQIAELEKQLS